MKITVLLLSLLCSLCVFSQSADNSVLVSGIEINDAAVDFIQKDIQGKEVKLSDFKGNYVLIDFWASWCAPCRTAVPDFINLYNVYHSKGFEILGVSLDKKREMWTQAVSKDALPWRNVSDLSGWSGQAARTYKIIALPSNILIDPKGKIIAKDLDAQSLDIKLKEVYSL